MKSIFKLSILILLSLTLQRGMSQTWPMPGAKWTYCITSGPSPAGYMHVSYVGDTIVNNKTYNVIRQIADSINPVPMASRILITRYSNDSVYRYVNQREYPYFSFNATAGSTYTSFRSAGFAEQWNDSACSSALPIKVVTAGTQTIHGLNLKKQTLHDTLFNTLYSPAVNWFPDYILVERIGVINGLPLINSSVPKGYPGDGCFLPSDYAYYTLGAYSDNAFSVVFSKCQGVGIAEKSAHDNCIKLFPNPFTDHLVIGETKVNYDNITICDMTGRQLFEKTYAAEIVKHNEVLNPDLSPGLYIICFRNKGMEMWKQIVVKD